MENIKAFLKAIFCSKRMYSFYWRLGDMIVIELSAVILANVDLLHIPQWVVIPLGLILGEITKYFNSKVKTS